MINISILVPESALIIIPALFGDLRAALEKNKDPVPWIAGQ